MQVSGFNVEHFLGGEFFAVFGRMNAVDRTNGDARGVLSPDAGLGNDVGHVANTPEYKRTTEYRVCRRQDNSHLEFRRLI